MTSRFAEIIPPYHRRGNCIPFAAIRWPDFGDQPSLGRPFGQFFRHSDTPLLSVSPGCRCPRQRAKTSVVGQFDEGPTMAQTGRSGVAGSRSEFHRIADIRAGMSGPVTSSIPFGTSKNKKKESKSSPFNRGIGQLSARSPNGRGVASLKHRNYEFRFCSSSFGLSSLIRRGKELPSTVAAIARPPYLTDG